MKIVYLAKITTSDGSGVNKKISAQIRAWRKQGAEVCPILIAQDKVIPIELKGLGAKLIVQRGLFSFFVRDRDVEREIFGSDPDLVYFRMGSLPFLSVSNIFQNPVILEINTKIFTELKVSYSGLKYHLLKILFKNILKSAVGYVGVTKECLAGLPNKPSIQCGNSIEFDRSLFEEVLEGRRSEKVCIFVGSSGCPWHGVDRLLEIARRNPDYVFRIVGYTKGNVEKSTQNDIPNNVELFGHVTGKDYERLLRESTIAFGSMAMDRNAMEYSSSLKNRDYLQFALPVIMQGRDSDLGSLECVTELPLDFDLSDVKKVLDKVAENGLTSEMGERIQNAIGVHHIEARRINFLKRFIVD